MLTSPITTPHFHSRVLSLLSSHLSLCESSGISDRNAPPAPIIPPFNPVDTPLTPGDTVSQFVGYCSPWIDLCSLDPLISNISRQVLTMEIAYAAFCGVGNIIIPGPRDYDSGSQTSDGLARYARAIQESLGIGGYLQMAIHLPMYPQADQQATAIVGDLAPFAREEYIQESPERDEPELFGSWDAWNVIRSVCKYNSRLSVGKKSIKQSSLSPFI
jgi:protein arginine N-methyltransferase 5